MSEKHALTSFQRKATSFMLEMVTFWKIFATNLTSLVISYPLELLDISRDFRFVNIQKFFFTKSN